MSLRFRKSFKLAPGLRMNVGKSGLSWTLGPRGTSIGIGKRGTYLSTGIPGSGFYSRQRIDSPNSVRKSSKETIIQETVTIHIDENNGAISFVDSKGNPASEILITAAKKQQGSLIKNMIQAECDKINCQLEALGQLHYDTPDPNFPPLYRLVSFDDPKPIKSIPIKVGFLKSLFKTYRERIEQENVEMQDKYKEAVLVWESAKQLFDDKESSRKQLIEHDIYSDPTAMNFFLEANLQDILWPKETDISFEIFEEGKRIFLDIDLPEIEDMPTKTATAPSRGYKLNIKELPASKVQKLYMQHIHGVGFRIIGETFSALPVSEEVILSAYSQRTDPATATAQIRNDYLYSVRVQRAEWNLIQFDNLLALDVVEALTKFELRRDMSRNAVFKPIAPITP